MWCNFSWGYRRNLKLVTLSDWGLNGSGNGPLADRARRWLSRWKNQSLFTYTRDWKVIIGPFRKTILVRLIKVLSFWVPACFTKHGGQRFVTAIKYLSERVASYFLLSGSVLYFLNPHANPQRIYAHTEPGRRKEKDIVDSFYRKWLELGITSNANQGRNLSRALLFMWSLSMPDKRIAE